MAVIKIEKTEVIKIPYIVAMIYGQPGLGKTSNAFTAENPVCFDFDGSSHRSRNRGTAWRFESWEDVVEQMKKPEELEAYDTIIIDTVGRAIDLLSVFIMNDEPGFSNKLGGLSQRGYGVLKVTFAAFITRLRSMGKDIILIAHRKIEKDNENRTFVPDIVGGSYDEIMKICDYIGFLDKSGKNRFGILNFNPTDRWEGKNPGQFSPLPVPDFSEDPRFWGKLIPKMKRSLGLISEEAREVAERIQEWAGRIDKLTTPEEIAGAGEEIAGITHPGIRVQVKALLVARMKKCKVSYSPEKGYHHNEEVAA